MKRLIDCTPEKKARLQEKLNILEAWHREFNEDGDLVSAELAERLLSRLESEDLFNEAIHRD